MPNMAQTLTCCTLMMFKLDLDRIFLILQKIKKKKCFSFSTGLKPSETFCQGKV